MPTKKIPISFNELDISNIKEMIDLMGIANTYGDFPKAIKYSITLALSYYKNPGKVYKGLNDDNLDIHFKLRSKVAKRLNAQEQAKKILETVE